MRALMAGTMALLTCAAAFTAQAQSVTYLRENIQSWAEPQKSRALGLELAYGRVTASEFRNEMLLLQVGDSPALLHRPAIEVVYSVETTKRGSSEVFFEIYLAEEGGLCRVVGMRYQQYFNAVPPWLRRKPVEKTST